MREVKFRAHISPSTIIPFTLEDLVSQVPIFKIRELVIPWLRAGNKPDEYTGRNLKSGEEVCEGNLIQCSGDNPHEIYWDVRTASFRGRVNGEMQFDKTRGIDMVLYKGNIVGNIH